MTNYRIAWDFTKAQPKWSNRLSNDFGKDNDGVIVQAENEKAAIEAFNNPRLPGMQYNPFYLSIKVSP